MPVADQAFRLVPRRRVRGLAFGAMVSARRGTGSDVASSRPYQPGDDVDTIDWNASARISSARGVDEFVVRERFAEEAPRVVVVCDRRPGMALFPPELPWLSKPLVLACATEVIAASTVAARGFAGYLDHADGGAFWHPPRSQRHSWEIGADRPFRAPPDALDRAFDHLARTPGVVPAGTFVFVLSDLLAPPREEAWLRAAEHRWDVVPVVVQDPLWERTFPALADVTVPIADPGDGRVRLVRVGRREAERRKAANEARFASLLRLLESLALEPVVLSSAEPDTVLAAFVEWSEQRRAWRGARW